MFDVFLLTAVIFIIHAQIVPFLISGSLFMMCSGSFRQDPNGL